MIFDETYFKSLNYTNYLDRSVRYKKLAKELHWYLWTKYRKDNYELLDYGCAVGFLVNGFRCQGVKCEGYDISEWARIEAEKNGVKFISFEPRKFDIMFAMDVFEHMADETIKKAIETFTPERLIIRIPCSMDGGKTFHLEVSKRDPTHINCKTKRQWMDFFHERGYTRFEEIDLYTIYDTDGVMCYLCEKATIGRET